MAIYEFGEILDAELAALPARFREVILLSQSGELTREEVAQRLGVTGATVKDRLERGREQLRSRLLRRGVTSTFAALAAWLIPGTAQAGRLTALATTNSQAAGAFATGSLVTEASSTAAALAQGILKMMGFEKLKQLAVSAVSFLTAVGIAFGILRDEPTRFEKGLRGQVVAVNTGKASTVTISLEEFGTLLNLGANGNNLDFNRDNEDNQPTWRSFAITAETIVILDGKPAKLVDLKRGSSLKLRLSDDGHAIRAIKASPPEAEDDKPESESR